MEAALSAKQVGRARAKILRREQNRVKNEPPCLSVPEERFNAASHGIGALLALAGMVLLLMKSTGGLMIMASLVYGISMITMMCMSALYHAMKSGTTAKRVCRRFDYISIYLLIGGTFAPIFLVYQGTKLGILLFCIQWCVILFGVTMIAVFGPGRFRPLHYTLFFTIGWSGLMFIPDFFVHNRMLLWFILAGGIVYTLGMVPFTRKQKYDHCRWHLFVLAAAALQWVGIYTCIY